MPHEHARGRIKDPPFSFILEKKMPFKSQAQRAFLYSQKPKIAKEFAAKTPKGKQLPKKVKTSIKKKKKS